MKFKIISSILLLFCFDLCLAYSDTNLNGIVAKNHKTKENIQLAKANKKTEETNVLEKIGPSNSSSIQRNSAEKLLPKGFIEPSIVLIDSVCKLNKSIDTLKSENSRLNEKIIQLSNQIISLTKELKRSKTNWIQFDLKIIDEIKKIIILLLVIITLIFFVFWIRLKDERYHLKTLFLNETMKIKKVDPPQIKQNSIQNPSFSSDSQKIDLVFVKDHKKSFSNMHYHYQSTHIKGYDWYLAGGSSIGKSHVSFNKPCQDNHYCDSLKGGWGIAVICDGAGSAENSHLGSEFLSKEAFEIFKDLLTKGKFVTQNKLPNEDEWRAISFRAFRNIYNSLLDFARKKKVDINSVASTIIVVVFTPKGLLSTHIGDGRAGYCDANGEWKSLITPHKGEEANQTIFITSSPWLYDDKFMMSNVLVPESKVITEKIKAFTLMSDGCETHSFDCSKIDNMTSKWSDPNLPYDKFFNPLINQLKYMHDGKIGLSEVTSSWHKFIEEGTIGIKEESDDKTLIVGILV